ncbi:hypothetical protein [Nocardioides zeae]
MTEQSTETTETTTPEGTEETFPREYVESLRQEAAKHRTEAKEARESIEPLQQRLHGLLVAGTGRLADPSDLPFDAGHLADEEAMTAAIDALLEAKPHLASRRVVGDAGQGAGQPTSEFSLVELMRG